MFVHRLRRWANIDLALSECLVFAGTDLFVWNYLHVLYV